MSEFDSEFIYTYNDGAVAVTTISEVGWAWKRRYQAQVAYTEGPDDNEACHTHHEHETFKTRLEAEDWAWNRIIDWRMNG